MMNSRISQQGFTLIELIVVIGLLAILGAVAIPAYARFFSSGSAEANTTELTLLQDAMSAMMADNKISGVTPKFSPTNNFTSLPTGPGAESLFPNFLRIGNDSNPTRCSYSWSARGNLNQSDCGSSGTALPGGPLPGSGDLPNGPGDVPAEGTAEEYIQFLLDRIEDFEASGTLNGGNTNALMVKLQHARVRFEAGDVAGAINSVKAFTNQVNVFLNAGKFTAEEGQMLLETADDLIVHLGSET